MDYSLRPQVLSVQFERIGSLSLGPLTLRQRTMAQEFNGVSKSFFNSNLTVHNPTAHHIFIKKVIKK